VNSPDEFHQMMGQAFATETFDPHPYGAPVMPVKTGLTPRGKVALAFGAAAIATSGLVGYQMYSADQAQSEAKAQEIAYKKDLLELEKLKVQGQVNETQASTDSVRQKHIDACVTNGKDLVGKSLNSSYRDIVDACQAQYTASSSTADMQTAASSHDTGGGVNGGLLIGGSVLAVIIVVAVKKSARGHEA
jgi:hypothetical protein